MKIGFHSNQLGLRGTEVAMFDYAHFNETILGNQSIIFYDRNAKLNHPQAVKKFTDRFPVFAYDQFSEVDDVLKRDGASLLYLIKGGENDGKLAPSVRNVVHAVFFTGLEQAHGNVYAYVSEWLANRASGGKLPFVPHTIHLPDSNVNRRVELKIPPDAFVFGYHGGIDSFNLPFVPAIMQHALNRRPNLYFLFMNVPPFCQHSRVMFLPGMVNLQHKVEFINTCDAMLHAQAFGESFGLSCAEFSIRNKPVLTFTAVKQRAHLEMLGDAAIGYANPQELLNQLLAMNHDFVMSRNWDRFSVKYSPAAVMDVFQRVFIEGRSTSSPA